MKTKWLVLAGIFWAVSAAAQDSVMVRIHFLYGSKPKKGIPGPKWFGGLWGGHTGIQIGDGQVVSFMPGGRGRIIGKPKKPQGRFMECHPEQFYRLLGWCDSPKTLVVETKIPYQQAMRLDSIHKHYLNRTPYDYAFLGMRCGAATYEILAQVRLLKPLTPKPWRRIFYVRRLRKRIIRQAQQQGWQTHSSPGSTQRKWEKD